MSSQTVQPDWLKLSHVTPMLYKMDCYIRQWWNSLSLVSHHNPDSPEAENCSWNPIYFPKGFYIQGQWQPRAYGMNGNQSHYCLKRAVHICFYIIIRNEVTSTIINRWWSWGSGDILRHTNHYHHQHINTQALLQARFPSRHPTKCQRTEGNWVINVY